jgi:hypothetical protein
MSNSIRIPAKVYDAVAIIQNFCENRDDCVGCPFKNTYMGLCVLHQIPEDWADFNMIRVNTKAEKL